MFKLYRVYSGWDEDDGFFIGYYHTKEQAEIAMANLAKEQMEVYYLQVTTISDNAWVYDYGSHTRFYKIIKEEE